VAEQKIRDVLERILSREPFTDCFLVELILHPNDKLEVFIECEGGVTFSHCKQLSRALEEVLDTEGWLGERYVLEVSSPGIGRPLKHRRQYDLNVGRKLKVELKDGRTLIGRLVGMEDEQLRLQPLPHKGKGKKATAAKKQMEAVEIPLEEVASAKVQVEF